MPTIVGVLTARGATRPPGRDFSHVSTTSHTG
jgi:hypothetical protein